MVGSGLDARSVHEFRRLQLLDELRRRLRALEWQPALDPKRRRRTALDELIAQFEAAEADELAALGAHSR